MPTAPDNLDAHDYAERIRERLPRRLQELRERCGLSKYWLARQRDISRNPSAGSKAARSAQRCANVLNTCVYVMKSILRSTKGSRRT